MFFNVTTVWSKMHHSTTSSQSQKLAEIQGETQGNWCVCILPANSTPQIWKVADIFLRGTFDKFIFFMNGRFSNLLSVKSRSSQFGQNGLSLEFLASAMQKPFVNWQKLNSQQSSFIKSFSCIFSYLNGGTRCRIMTATGLESTTT